MSRLLNGIIIIAAIMSAGMFINRWNESYQLKTQEISTVPKTAITETHNGIVFTQTRLGSMNATCIIGSTMGSTMMSCKFDKK